MQRRTPPRPATVLALTLLPLLVVGGCGERAAEPRPEGSPPSRGDAAVWALGDDSLLDPAATFFVADVTRLACAGGETGELLEPAVTYQEDRVLVRVDAAPLPPGGHDCQGNDAVATEVHLEEPLGFRALVDAACVDGEAAATPVCGDGPEAGVRWAPPADLQPVSGVPDWQPPADYTFTAQGSCGEQSFIGEYEVGVRDGRVADVEPLRRGWDIPVESVPTLADLLQRAREADAQGDAEVWTDPDGVPRWISLDPMPDAIDDETCVLVTDYRPG